MGPLKQHKARADFSSSFLEPGGFEIIVGSPADSVEEAVEALLSSSAKVAVLCSTDETYPDLVPKFTEVAKKKIPFVKIILAGYPEAHIESFKEAGISEFIYLKANNLDSLVRIQEMAGV